MNTVSTLTARCVSKMPAISARVSIGNCLGPSAIATARGSCAGQEGRLAPTRIATSARM